MAGETILYRKTALSQTNTVADRVEIDGTASVPDNRAGLMAIRAVADKSRPSNPEPFVQSVTKPDSGYRGTVIEMDIFLHENGATALAVQRIMEWMSEDQTTRTFPNGNIGLTCNFLPQWNLNPTAASGYKVVRIEDYKDMRVPTMRALKITLEHSGLFSSLKGPTDE